MEPLGLGRLRGGRGGGGGIRMGMVGVVGDGGEGFDLFLVAWHVALVGSIWEIPLLYRNILKQFGG